MLKLDNAKTKDGYKSVYNPRQIIAKATLLKSGFFKKLTQHKFFDYINRFYSLQIQQFKSIL